MEESQTSWGYLDVSMIEFTAGESTQDNEEKDPPTLVQKVSSFSVANI